MRLKYFKWVDDHIPKDGAYHNVIITEDSLYVDNVYCYINEELEKRRIMPILLKYFGIAFYMLIIVGLFYIFYTGRG